MFNLKIPTKEDVFEKRCLVRVDFNSSFEGGDMKNEFRIEKTMPLINWLKENKAKIILMTHIEDNNGRIPHLDEFYNEFKTNFFEKSIRENIYFLRGIINNEIKEKVLNLAPSNIILLDNLRLDAREEKGDEEFGRELSSLGDIYINEAFSVSHRKHASVVKIPKFIPGFPGFNFISEIENLSLLLNPETPFFVFIGGKKTSTKEQVISKFLDKADGIILGGLMAAEFYLAQNRNIGKTPFDEKSVKMIKQRFLDGAGKISKKITLPENFIVLREEKKIEININEILDNDFIYDIAPSFFELLKNKIIPAKMILWNGPMGFIEQGYTEGTLKLCSLFKESNAKIIVGGGETVDFIKTFNLIEGFSFISTGGGAMLQFLADETLPGIEALK